MFYLLIVETLEKDAARGLIVGGSFMMISVTSRRPRPVFDKKDAATSLLVLGSTYLETSINLAVLYKYETADLRRVAPAPKNHRHHFRDCHVGRWCYICRMSVLILRLFHPFSNVVLTF